VGWLEKAIVQRCLGAGTSSTNSLFASELFRGTDGDVAGEKLKPLRAQM
jgi:hypothetical protein